MTEENIINTEVLEPDTSEEAAENAENAEADEKAAQETEEKEAEDKGSAEIYAEEENVQETEQFGEIDAEVFKRTLANPMFAVFAKGRSTDISTAVRDFLSMMEAGRSLLTEEAMMKMTPHNGFSGADGVALTERQRKIARDAGMSYREYYELISVLPEKNKR